MWGSIGGMEGSKDIGGEIQFVIRIGSEEGLLGTRVKHRQLGRRLRGPFWPITTDFIASISTFGMCNPLFVLQGIFL